MAATSTQGKTGGEDVALPHAGTCARCGTPIDAGDNFCATCGVGQQPPPPGPPPKASDALQQKYFRCQQCGAEVAADPRQRSYVCPFCDSTFVVEYSPTESGRQAPEFVIGFAVTPQQALDKFRIWIGQTSWFRPGDMGTAQIEEKLRGVYLPFWTFSMLAESDWCAEIGEYWYRTETYTAFENGKPVTRTRTVTETEWWPLEGKHHKYYYGYLVSASRGLSQADADQLMPFEQAALKRYEPYFLAGWLAEEYSLARDNALEQFEGKVCLQEDADIGQFLPGDTHRSMQVQTRFSDVNSDLILLPMYVLSYRYGDKLYRFMLNGQTGKVAGEKPVSPWRIGLAVAAAVAAAIVLVLFFKLLS
jgi:DNA-directed RNA polymerase subunit RPC12/RpoP